jgi:hypothetical protein
MNGQVEQDAEVAVAELRLFLAAYEDVDIVPGSRTAKQLDAARRAVAAYDAVQLALAENAA